MAHSFDNDPQLWRRLGGPAVLGTGELPGKL